MELLLPTEFSHTSVLLEETIEALITNIDGLYIDGTFGMGGHSKEILKRISASGRLLAIDKDPSAVAIGKQMAAEDNRLTIKQGSFSELHKWTEQNQIDGLLLDLGVSSPQLDNPNRGFSFMQDGPLDMRMDTTTGETAAEWLADVSYDDLCRVLWDYGEERYARKIATAIITNREQQQITTTSQLVNIITSTCKHYQRHKHPATRTFQAIRIYINKELEHLQQALTIALDNMKIGGRLVVISFHSLEDRIVKRFMRQNAQGKPLPKWLPVTDISANSKLKLIGKHKKPSHEEIKDNTRARSAVLRIAEKIA
jgi:16S rRNA (cytosine1402-N4)-methyltransferase